MQGRVALRAPVRDSGTSVSLERMVYGSIAFVDCGDGLAKWLLVERLTMRANVVCRGFATKLLSKHVYNA